MDWNEYGHAGCVPHRSKNERRISFTGRYRDGFWQLLGRSSKRVFQIPVDIDPPDLALKVVNYRQ